MSPLATLRQPSLPGHFSSDCCSTHCRGRQAWWGGGWRVGVLVSWIAGGERRQKKKGFAVMLVEQLSLGGITLHYLTGLHGRRCRTGTPQRAPGVQKWAAGGCTCTQYSTSTAYGGANGRLCDCSGCWFITLARSRPILLIIIFVKLIISVSVSVTVPMNYTRITLINQQNGFWGKCFVHMDVLPFRERLMSSPFISVLTSIISHRRIVLRRALRLSSLYP